MLRKKQVYFEFCRFTFPLHMTKT